MMPTEVQRSAHLLFSQARVIPVVSLDDVQAGVRLAETCLANGLPVLEMTLRTPNALKVSEAIARRVPDCILGIGTVMTASQMADALSAGARFLVSPGTTPVLAEAAAASPVPFLPGVATVSEAMRLQELGFRLLKFFPAEASGGVAALKGFQPVLPDIQFCPTGGISPQNAPAYLAQPNVVGVGGSWIAPQKLLTAGDFDAIAAFAREAAGIRPQ